MKFIDLFAGIGGFHLGLEQAGHECVGWVEWDKFARQSYQAIHDGADKLWNEKDINDVKAEDMPKADLWAFGFPCQDISVAGKQGGFTNGKRSSLFFTVTELLRELKEEDKPKYLLIENVKNLLSINKGWDFAKLQIELDEIGYDIEWDVLNSAEVVPQHRERIFIVGHLRGRSTRKVFPITRENGQTVSPKQKIIRMFDGRNAGTYGSQDVVSPDGIAGTLNTMGGGNREPKIAIREATKQGYTEAGVGDSVKFSQPNSKTRRGRVGHGVANTLETGLNQGVVVPVLTPDRINKRQNGRRFKENGDPMFTINTVDRHGIAINDGIVPKEEFGRLGRQAVETMNTHGAKDGDIIEPFNYRVHKNGITRTITTRPEGLKTAILPVTNGLRIRKLTPLECWRLQGFPDWAFDRAQDAGVSNSQLYKQAGNSVTVSVVHAIAERLDDEEITEKFPN